MKKSTKGLTKRLITAGLFDILSYNVKMLPIRLKKDVLLPIRPIWDLNP